MDRTDEWTGWVAVIAPCSPWPGNTPSNRFGVWWQNAPAMERRGGYSGSFASRIEAEQCVQRWVDTYDLGPGDVTVEHRNTNPDDEANTDPRR